MESRKILLPLAFSFLLLSFPNLPYFYQILFFLYSFQFTHFVEIFKTDFFLWIQLNWKFFIRIWQKKKNCRFFWENVKILKNIFFLGVFFLISSPLCFCFVVGCGKWKVRNQSSISLIEYPIPDFPRKKEIICFFLFWFDNNLF